MTPALPCFIWAFMGLFIRAYEAPDVSHKKKFFSFFFSLDLLCVLGLDRENTKPRAQSTN